MMLNVLFCVMQTYPVCLTGLLASSRLASGSVGTGAAESKGVTRGKLSNLDLSNGQAKLM